MLAYRGNHDTWYAVRARIDNNGHTATARVRHLSTWTGIDLETYFLEHLEAALQPTASTASNTCPHVDSLVSVAGAGPLPVCVSDPDSSRTAEEVILSDPTKTAFSISNCTGGLGSLCSENLINNGYLGVLGVGNTFRIPYNATHVTSTVQYTPNIGSSATDDLVTALGDLFGDGGGLLASVAPCVQKDNPTSLVAGFIDGVACVFSAGLGPINIGPIHLGAIGQSVEESVLKDAAAKAAQRTPLEPGGVITLTSQQQLPPVGGTTTPPVAVTPPSSPSEPGGLASYTYYVYGTCADGACGLHVRSGPGYSSYALVGSLAEGAEVNVVCQALGETVGPSPTTGNSSAIWDMLTGGGWVSDLYLTTPDVGTWSPPIPHC